MTTSFKELALKKWLELTQLMGTNPEAIQRIDWQKWLSTTLAKFEENPEDIMKDDFMDMLKSKITEPEKELRSILLQKPYSPTVPIDHESHAKLLQIFMMSDEYKEGTKNILTGKIKPLPQFIKKKIFDRWLEHTEKEFLGEPQQPQQPPPPAPPSPSPLAKKQDMMNNKPDQILPDIESQARSMGGQISQPI